MMTTHTKIAWIGIAAIIILAGSSYVYYRLSHKPAAPGSVSTAQQAPAPRIFLGTIVSVASDGSQITVQGLPGTKDPFSHTAAILPSTRIEKIVTQTGLDGKPEKQLVVEVDTNALVKGQKVTVEYAGDSDTASRIVFVVESNIDAYIKQSAAAAENNMPYLKGRIIAVDPSAKTIRYYPYAFGKVETSEKTVAVPDGVKVYTVDDPVRITITRAWVPATYAALQTNATFFIVADSKALKDGKVVAQAFVVSEK